MSEENLKGQEGEFVESEQQSDEVVESADEPALEGDLEQGQVQPETISGAELNELVNLRARLTSLQEELDQQKDQALRTQAEAQNARRRAEKDVENAHKYALEKFVNELLPVLDGLERGLESIPEDDTAQQASREGIVLTMKMLLDVFKKFNVEQLDPKGETFNPQIHQAMSMQESSEIEPNTVVAVLQKGFTLNGRLVRPAMVMVSKAAKADAPTG